MDLINVYNLFNKLISKQGLFLFDHGMPCKYTFKNNQNPSMLKEIYSNDFALGQNRM